MRLAAPRSVVNAGPAGLSGCPAATSTSRLSRASLWLDVLRRPPLPCENGFILPRGWPPLQSTDRFEPAPRTDARGAFPGVSVPIATSAAEIHLRAKIPTSPYVPPPVFRTPSTAFSLHDLVGLFHPTATSGIHLSGACSHHPASAPRRRAVPSCRLPSSPAVDSRRRFQLRWHRLQGLDPGGDPQRPPGGLVPTTPDPLLGFAPSGSLRASWLSLRSASARDLGIQFLRESLDAGLQRLDRCPS
jgi:hypothetical protein